jgi:hypothetical protein
MNGEGFGLMWSYSDQSTILIFLPGGAQDKPRNFSVRMGSGLAKNVSRRNMNAGLKWHVTIQHVWLHILTSVAFLCL